MRIFLLSLLSLLLTSCSTQPTVDFQKNYEKQVKELQDLKTSQTLGIAEEISLQQTIQHHASRHMKELRLSSLDMYGVRITKADLKPLAEPECAKYLRTLHLEGIGLTDDALEAISEIPLEMLDVAKNKLRDLHAIKDMHSLTYLIAGDQPLSDDAYHVIGGLKSLESLDLSEATIKAKNFSDIYRLHQLKAFRIIQCPDITDADVTELKKHLPKGCFVSYEPASRNSADSDIHKLNDLFSEGNYPNAERAVRLFLQRYEQKSPLNNHALGLGHGLLARCLTHTLNLRKNETDRESILKEFESSIKYLEASKDEKELPPLLHEYALLLERSDRIDRAVPLRQQIDSMASKAQNYRAVEPDLETMNLIALGSDYKKLSRTKDETSTFKLAARSYRSLKLPQEQTTVKKFVQEHGLDNGQTTLLFGQK